MFYKIKTKQKFLFCFLRVRLIIYRTNLVKKIIENYIIKIILNLIKLTEFYLKMLIGYIKVIFFTNLFNKLTYLNVR